MLTVAASGGLFPATVAIYAPISPTATSTNKAVSFVRGTGRYDIHSGRMVRGPQRVFARVPGLGTAFTALTRVVPLRRAEVTERDGQVIVRG